MYWVALMLLSFFVFFRMCVCISLQCIQSFQTPWSCLYFVVFILLTPLKMGKMNHFCALHSFNAKTDLNMPVFCSFKKSLHLVLVYSTFGSNDSLKSFLGMTLQTSVCLLGRIFQAQPGWMGSVCAQMLFWVQVWTMAAPPFDFVFA